jgi:hypothetical protein
VSVRHHTLAILPPIAGVILHIPLFFESVFVFCSAGQSGGPVGQTKGKNSPSTPQMAVLQPFNFFNPLQNAILR